MKNIKLMWHFAKKNMVSLSIIAIALMLVLFILLSVWSQILLATYTKSILVHQKNYKNSVYCYATNHEIYNNDITSITNYKNTLLSQLETYDIVKDVLTYDTFELNLKNFENSSVMVDIYSPQMVENFQLDLKEGRWFSKSNIDVEAVICGSKVEHIKIGDLIKLDFGINAIVVGKVAYNKVPHFSGIGSSGTSDSLFRSVDESRIILNKPGGLNEVINKLRSAGKNRNMIAFIIKCREEVSENDINSVLNTYFIDNGLTHISVQKIIDNTDIMLEETMKEILPIPIFLLLISSISLLSISAIMIQRSMNDHAKFYLLGCSKKRSILILILIESIFLWIPFVTNIILALCFPDFLRKDTMWDLSDAIISFQSFLPLIIYTVIIGMILALMPLIYYKKYSPLTFYRRNI